MRYAIRDEIRRLDPELDDQRIVFLSTCYDFPFDTTRALEFALFRTFCVPSISSVLDGTGEFRHRAQRRYDDTDILISEILEWGYESERGQRSIERINQLHSRFAITNDDFRYVLSTFIYEPIRWNARFGWRPMCHEERLAYFYFWRNVGRRMHIRDIPSDYVAFEQLNREYEQEHFRFAETNRRTGLATRELFAGWVPRPAAPLVRSAIYAVMDEPLREAFGFPRSTPLLRWLVPRLLRARAGWARRLPPRRRPRLRTVLHRAAYPAGHVIERVGPPDR